jgi:hypothetical protein
MSTSGSKKTGAGAPRLKFGAALAAASKRAGSPTSASSAAFANGVPKDAAQPVLENDDATLTPEEKNFLDYLVQQALRTLLDDDTTRGPNVTPHRKET